MKPAAVPRSAEDIAWRFKFKRNWRREQLKVRCRSGEHRSEAETKHVDLQAYQAKP